MRTVIFAVATLTLLILALMLVPSKWHLVIGFMVGSYGMLLFPGRKK